MNVFFDSKKGIYAKKIEDRVFLLSLHREMWDWLSENLDKRKEDWPRWKSNGGDIENVPCDCFCCHHAWGYSCVPDCPLVWPGFGCIEDNAGLFSQYDAATNDKDRKELAMAIRDLPVKPGVKWV